MFMKNFASLFIALAGILSLISCSSGSDVSTTVAGGGRGGAEYGFVSLNITDAPIDNATEVWVQFDGVEFMPADASQSGPILVTFDAPMQINLLELQGTKSKPLLINEILPTGVYDWVRLKMTATRDGILDSYIVLDDGSVHELDMPGGSEIGLQINGGLEVVANTASTKTIDFDLRQSIIMAGLNNYQIQPVLHIVNNNQAGAIEGSVSLLTLMSWKCSDLDPSSGNAVYLYDGFGITPDDVGGAGPQPVASAMVKLNSTTGEFEYSFGYVPFGQYTASFTCEADIDDPVSDDVINFSATKNVNVNSTGVITLKRNAFRFKGKNGNGNDDD